MCGGGGGVINSIGNAVSSAVQSVGSGLASVDKAVSTSVPGGWATLGGAALAAATGGASLLADGTATALDSTALVTDPLSGGSFAGDAFSTAGAAASQGAGVTAEGEIGLQGAQAAGEATGGVAVDSAGLPVDTAVESTAGSGAAGAGAGASAWNASNVISGLGAAVGLANLAGTLMTPKVNIPSATPPVAPPTPQTASLASGSSVQNSLVGTGQAGGSIGVAQTLLTGAGGVDPSTLNLGKNTLLGS